LLLQKFALKQDAERGFFKVQPKSETVKIFSI